MSRNHEERTALYAGSFDPFTIGHASVVARGLDLFDRVVIAIGHNADKPDSGARAAQRALHIAAMYEGHDRVKVVTYDTLTAAAAVKYGARWLLRGLRNATDLDYEMPLADVNRRLEGLETVFLPSLPQHMSISSSMVRDLQRYGCDVSQYLPKASL